MALRGVELQLLVAELEPAGHRQSLDLAECERPRARDVQLGVVVSQVALGGAGLAVEALHRRLAEAERQPREGEAPQQVIEVGVGGEQAVGLEAGSGQQAGESVQLVREVGGVDHERLPSGAERRGGGLPDAARQHERVAVDRDGPQAAFSSFPASRKVFTSASGFLAPASSSSPWRLTQITAIFCLRQGSTSVG